jgi:hypothetical protein
MTWGAPGREASFGGPAGGVEAGGVEAAGGEAGGAAVAGALLGDVGTVLGVACATRVLFGVALEDQCG